MNYTAVEFARWELSNPTLEQCLERYPQGTPLNYYKKMAMCPSKTLFLALFAKKYDECIRMRKMQAMIRADEPFAIEVPPPMATVSPSHIVLIPRVLQYCTNWVLKAFHKEPAVPPVELPTFPMRFPAEQYDAPPVNPTAEMALAYLKKIHQVNLAVLQYAVAVERYQAAAYHLLESIS